MSNENLPDGWQLDFFEKHAKITCGIAATPEYVGADEGVPFLSARNVKNAKLKLDKFQHIKPDLHAQLTKKTKPEKGDLLLTRVGSGIGEAAVVDIDFEFSVYVSLTLIKCKNTLNVYYLKQVLNSPYYRYLATREQFAGGGVQNLNVQIVKRYKILIPPLDEQIRIASILEEWDTAIEKTEALIEAKERQFGCLPPIEEQKRIAHTLNTAQQEITLLKKLADQYRTQKRGLMQKMLSGEWH